MSLWPRISILRLLHLARCRINIIVPLRRSGRSISKIEASIEPLRRIWCAHLPQKHERHFVIKCLGIVRRIKIPVLLTPIAPATHHPMHHLLDGMLTARHRLTLAVGYDVPLLVALQNTRFAEILLRKNISRNLRPLGWNLDIRHLKNL